MGGLNPSEVHRVVHDYIGVRAGYLGDFSYRTHAAFYPRYCNLHIDPDHFSGTTKERFVQILESAGPGAQARILRGVLARFPITCFPPDDRPAKREVRDEIKAMIARLSRAGDHQPLRRGPAGEAVRQALAEAEILLDGGIGTGALERAHALLHRLLVGLCREAALPFGTDATLPTLFNVLTSRHPVFVETARARSEPARMLQALGVIVDGLSAERVRSDSGTLDRADILLALHSARALLAYVEAKVEEDEAKGT